MPLKKKFVAPHPATGEPTEFAATAPSPAARMDAHIHQAAVFHSALGRGVPIQAAAIRRAQDLGTFDAEAATQALDLEGRIAEAEGHLRGGDFARARRSAIELGHLRSQLNALNAGYGAILENSCDGIARQAEHDHLTAACTVHEDGPLAGTRLWPTPDDFLRDRESAAGVAAATALYEVLNGPSRDRFEALPEVAFLRKFRLIDADGRFVDKDGNFVDEDGVPLPAAEPAEAPAPAEPVFTDAEGHPVAVPA